MVHLYPLILGICPRDHGPCSISVIALSGTSHGLQPDTPLVLL